MSRFWQILFTILVLWFVSYAASSFSKTDFREKIKNSTSMISGYLKEKREPIFSPVLNTLYTFTIESDETLITITRDLLSFLDDKDDILTNNLRFMLYLLAYEDLHKVTNALHQSVDGPSSILLNFLDIVIPLLKDSGIKLDSIKRYIVGPKNQSQHRSVEALGTVIKSIFIFNNSKNLRDLIKTTFKVTKGTSYPSYHYIQLLLSLLDNDDISYTLRSTTDEENRERIFNIIKYFKKSSEGSFNLTVVREELNHIFTTNFEFVALTPLFNNEETKHITFLLSILYIFLFLHTHTKGNATE